LGALHVHNFILLFQSRRPMVAPTLNLRIFAGIIRESTDFFINLRHTKTSANHPQLVAVYHQCEALYIIDAKHRISSMQSIVYHQGAGDYARCCVMRYSPEGTDDIPFLRNRMICQAYGRPQKLDKLASGNPYCGLDTKKELLKTKVLFLELVM